MQLSLALYSNEDMEVWDNDALVHGKSVADDL